jgi:hypothetical protein
MTQVAGMALLFAGCGGGGSGLPDEQPQIADAVQQPAESTGSQASGPETVESLLQINAELLRTADPDGTRKRSYTVTNSLGLYGKQLEGAGWKFDLTPVAQIPNTLDTILYINASAVDLEKTEALRNLATDFKGVMVIDSNDRPRTEYDQKTGKPKSDEAQTTAKSQASDFVEWAANGALKTVQVATALMISRPHGTSLAIDVDSEGRVNGADRETMTKLFSPLLEVTLAQRDRAAGRSSLRTYNKGGSGDSVQREKYGLAPWDSYAIFQTVANGWMIGGVVFVYARKTPALNSGLVTVSTWSGNNMETCILNGGAKCGVYPMSKDDIVKRVGGTGYGAGSMMRTYGPAYEYKAFATISRGTLREFSPSARAWTATENRETDSFDTVWSEGFSVGGSASFSTARSFSFGPSASYSFSRTYRRTTHLWDADEWINAGGRTAPAHAWTIIKNKNFRRPNFIPVWEEVSPPEERSDAYANTGRRVFRERYLNAYHEWRNVPGGGCDMRPPPNTKPKMSYEGWQPAIDAIFEVDFGPTGTFTGVDVSGGFQLTRESEWWAREFLARCGTGRSTRVWGYHRWSNDELQFDTHSATMRVLPRLFLN